MKSLELLLNYKNIIRKSSIIQFECWGNEAFEHIVGSIYIPIDLLIEFNIVGAISQMYTVWEKFSRK